MSIHTASAEHETTYQELVELLNRHPGLSAEQVLALAANLTGKLIAMQNQHTMTPARAMEIVNQNMILGNQQALAQVSGPAAGSA